ncbi:GDSL esterase/lipase [Escovopsis weberi]|uniref:GDSL esterase/lipase n=1 Tax=Escovopsis weberi TaxID=150374 RepID=A0A0M8MT05_ESCWE|nr:GDSL esterase/lipase [Escovopsis weberi]
MALFSKPGPQTPKIDYLLILLGANDAVVPLKTVHQFVPIEQYKKNLGAIINHPHIAVHKPTILLVTPPPVDEVKLTRIDTAEGHASATRTADRTAKYAETAREVAQENPQVVLVDLWQAVMAKAIEMTPGGHPSDGPLLGSLESGKQGGLDVLLPDGLHMGSIAYKVFWDQVVPHFGGERDPEDKSGYHLPEWRSLGPVNRSS